MYCASCLELEADGISERAFSQPYHERYHRPAAAMTAKSVERLFLVTFCIICRQRRSRVLKLRRSSRSAPPQPPRCSRRSRRPNIARVAKNGRAVCERGTARERRGGGGLGRRAKRSKGAPAESARRRCTEEGRTAHVRVGVTNGLGEVFSDANCQVPRALPSVPLSYTQRCLFLSERLPAVN